MRKCMISLLGLGLGATLAQIVVSAFANGIQNGIVASIGAVCVFVSTGYFVIE